MSCRSRRQPEGTPPVTTTYLVVFAALVVILLPTLLSVWIGHPPVINLLP